MPNNADANSAATSVGSARHSITIKKTFRVNHLMNYGAPANTVPDSGWAYYIRVLPDQFSTQLTGGANLDIDWLYFLRWRQYFRE